MPIRYYHVMHKNGKWHLYFGNSTKPVLVDPCRSVVVKAARSLARQSGMKVIIHRPQETPPRRGGTDPGGQNGN